MNVPGGDDHDDERQGQLVREIGGGDVSLQRAVERPTEPCDACRQGEHRDLGLGQVDPHALGGRRAPAHGCEEPSEGPSLDQHHPDHADGQDHRREDHEVAVAGVASDAGKEVDRADLRPRNILQPLLPVAGPREVEEELVAQQRERECEECEREAGDPYRL